MPRRGRAAARGVPLTGRPSRALAGSTGRPRSRRGAGWAHDGHYTTAPRSRPRGEGPGGC
eukprot:scaffold1770_cov375-Prasinococcus_capsulatus_cf.AAC.29